MQRRHRLLDWEPAIFKQGSQGGKTSVWRSIFVANEAEMQTKRKIDPNFTLFWLVFLIGLGQENVATMQPAVSNLFAPLSN